MSSTARTGVVLAAGFGSRLKGVVASTDLKPLTPVAGTPLIIRTLISLEKAGYGRVVIVLGHHAETLRTGIEAIYSGPLELVFAMNERYQKQNGLSVLAARPFIEGGFILTMADHVFGDEVMVLAGSYVPEPGHAALLVDYKLDSIFDMDDATKALVEDGNIIAIDKKLADFNAVDTGVFVCTDGLMDVLQALDDENGDASLSDGVRRLAASGRMHALDIGDGFWQDVDTPEMMSHATKALQEQ